MRLAPWIAREHSPDGILGLGLDHVSRAVLVCERPAQDDEACVHEPVHEGRVRGPFGLLFQRPRRVPLRAGAAKHDEERRHARVLPHGPWRPIRAHPATTSAVGGRPGTVS